MKTEQLSPEKSLEILTKMQEEYKQSIQDDGVGWIVQSIAVIVLALLHYILAYNGIKWAPAVWLGIGISSALVIWQARNKEKGIQSQLSKFLKFLWIAFSISIFLIITILIYFQVYNLIFPLCFVLYGFGLFVNAAIIKFRAMFFSAAFCWLMAIATLFVPGQEQLLMMCAVFMGGFLTPGILLYRAKKQGINE